MPYFFRHALLRCAVLALSLAMLAAGSATAGPLRNLLRDRLAQQDELSDEGNDTQQVTLPAGVHLLRDIAYGSDPLQRFDVYLPDHAQSAAAMPVIFMVHGGGWRRGDKAMARMVQNKMAHWVPQGFAFISVNYRLLPAAAPLEQARDVARALEVAQQKAASWGADRSKFILMGHSAGAHLVSLVAVDRALTQGMAISAPIATVALDSATLDVVQTMESRHFRLHDQAFGSNRDDWIAVSPYQQLNGKIAPFLAVCSTRRSDSCPQADRFVAKLISLGSSAEVLREDLSHREINEQLGLPGAYTAAVDAFLKKTDPAVAARLAAH